MKNDDEIRKPDAIVCEQLIPSAPSLIPDIPAYILEESIKNYELKLQQEQEMERILRLSEEEYNRIEPEDEIETILRISKEEYELTLQQEKEIEKLLFESSPVPVSSPVPINQKIQKSDVQPPVPLVQPQPVSSMSESRKTLLSDLMRRIDFLSMTSEGKYIQSVLHPIIEDYINTSEICCPSDDPIIRQFLDELYTIPKSKGKKTAITEDVYRLFTT